MKKRIYLLVTLLLFCVMTYIGSKLVISAKDPAVWSKHFEVKVDSKPFTGLFYDVHQNGNLSFLATYRDGKIHGFLFKWYSNGQMRVSQRYSQGKPHGAKLGWFADGSPQYKKQYDMGKGIGETWAWHPNGKIAEYIRYGGDLNESAYKSWQGVGLPFYNQVMKNNDRVGMKGGNFCKPQTRALKQASALSR